MRKSSSIVYALLALLLAAILFWQVVEHRRLRQAVEESQLNRAHDIANSLAVVIRSQRRLGVVSRQRLVGALEALAQSRELLGIALLSPAGEVVAAGGQAIQGDLADLAPGTFRRAADRLLVAALVELGPELPPPGAPPPGPPPSAVWTEAAAEKAAAAVLWDPEEQGEREPQAEDGQAPPPGDERARRRSRWERWHQSHPFMQSPEKYRELYEKQGLHMMVLMLNDQPAQGVINHDWLLRLAMATVALAAAVGAALAWRSLTRSTELELRLTRARALNSYLRELNLAAAGLAHETRNPLNLVRGIAQMVSSDVDTPKAARDQLGRAMEEVDRITARLNEFIDYAKPREPRPVPVSPVAVARDVARTLETDLDDKAIHFECPDHPLEIMADPTMLRQVLFNLLLNAVQAVPRSGHIAVRLLPRAGWVDLEVVDDGPGIPPEAQSEIFRPYFTLSDHGTGLGLAVVRQIALAHGWEVSHIPNPTGGCIFRLSRLLPSGAHPA
jgi:signal transduction histidine kinase